MVWSPSPVSGPDSRGLSRSDQQTRAGLWPTARHRAAGARGNRRIRSFTLLDKSLFVKAVCPLAAGGCGCSVAEKGPGGAGAAGGMRIAGGIRPGGRRLVAACRGGGPNIGRVGWPRARPYAGGECRRMKLIAASSDRGSASSG